MRHGGVAVIGTLGIALTLAISCGPEAEEKPKADRDECEIFCERHLQCRNDPAYDSEEACIDECLNSPAWTGPCSSQNDAYMRCVTAPEQACPTFSEVGLSSEDAPCYDENNDYSICLNKERQ